MDYSTTTLRPFPNLFVIDLDNLSVSTYLVRNDSIAELQAPSIPSGSLSKVRKGEFWPVSTKEQCRISSYDYVDSTKSSLVYLNCIDPDGNYTSASIKEPELVAHPGLFTDLSWVDADGSRVDWNGRIWDVRFTDKDWLQLVSMSTKATDFKAYEAKDLPSHIDPYSTWLGAMGISKGDAAFVWLSAWQPATNEWEARDLVNEIILYRVNSDYSLTKVQEYELQGTPEKWHSWIVDDSRIALVLGESLYLFKYNGDVIEK